MWLILSICVCSKVKTLAEDDWLDDTAAWVERSRKMAKEKELAEKRVSGGERLERNGLVAIPFTLLLCWFLSLSHLLSPTL